MDLDKNARLGPYEVLGQLGAGGMGEVYRARETRLGREVALKVIPDEFANDPERRRRFEQEARAASALSHPNIVAIFDIGREGETSYLAMELIEGSSLRGLLPGQPLPPKRLLSIAAQVAEGLAAAHEKGIVHRDLKPENLMVDHAGRVKILDFGLAKLALPASGSMESATVSVGTSEGTILGTVGYMSPEQASGKPADFRSDQFSLGAIVYEMATGRRAFRGATAVETSSIPARSRVRISPAVRPARYWKASSRPIGQRTGKTSPSHAGPRRGSCSSCRRGNHSSRHRAGSASPASHRTVSWSPSFITRSRATTAVTSPSWTAAEGRECSPAAGRAPRASPGGRTGTRYGSRRRARE